MLPSNSKKKSIPASLRARKPAKPTSTMNLSPEAKKAILGILRKSGVAVSDGIPASLRKPKASGTSANSVGLGSKSPLTKTSLATNPKRALDPKEWEMAAEGATGISSKNSAGANAALAAMAFLPVPGLKNIGAVARAGGKAAATTGKVAKPAAKLSKAEARDLELADIKRLMMPDPRPARAAAKFSADDGIRQAMRGKSGKALTTGPKPVRANYKTNATFKNAMKRWESKLAANRAAVRGGGDSLPVAPKATPSVKKPSLKKDAAPAVKKDTPAVAKKPTVKKPSAKKPAASTDLVRVPLSRGQKASGPSVATNNKIPLSNKPTPGTALSTRPGASASSTASKAVVKERGVPTFSYARPTTAAGRAQLAIEGPKKLAKRPTAAIAAGRPQLALEGPKTAAKTGMSKKKKALIGAAGATGLLFAGGEVLKRLDGKDSKTSAASGAEGLKRQVLTDKYGRQIGRAEYNRREKYRASIVGKTPKQVEKMRQAEAKRREKFRNTDGKKMFGALASKKSKNLNVPVGVKVRKIRQGPVSPQNIRDRERFK